MCKSKETMTRTLTKMLARLRMSTTSLSLRENSAGSMNVDGVADEEDEACRKEGEEEAEEEEAAGGAT
jgi:hypothetical protein